MGTRSDCPKCGAPASPTDTHGWYCPKCWRDYQRERWHAKKQPILRTCDCGCGEQYTIASSRSRRRFVDAKHKQHFHFETARRERAAMIRERRCEVCSEPLPADARSDRRTCSDICAQRRRRDLRGPDALRLRRHESKLREYGLTVEQYARMLVHQDGGCAICAQTCPTGRLLAVDHDHATGAVRGLLCSRCNHGLGHFKDETDLLRRAIAYLDNS